MILLFTGIVFIIGYAGLILYYKRGWRSLPAFISAGNGRTVFISVVVAARNEEKRIGSLLKTLEQQSYPGHLFEIIVVDDFSADATADVVKQFPLSNLFLIQPEVAPAASSKKKAVEAGIKQAKGELIVTTDADCTVPANWLQTLSDFYVQRDAAFIAAPVKFYHDRSLLQIFQSLDFLVLQGITAASAGNRFPVMCNGANLAYKKQVFAEVKGFEGIDKTATGDDMLLMHKIGKRYPAGIFYLKSREAIVGTAPEASWKDFFMQRKRWASKTLVYDDRRLIVLLAFVYLFNGLFVALLAASFFNSLCWWYTAGYLMLKTLIEWPFVRAVAGFYGEEKLMKYFIPFQPLHIFYTVVVGMWSQFGKYRWKERTTK